MTEARPVVLGGVTQWITLRGPPGAPMLLYLHGGPGGAELFCSHLFSRRLVPRFRVVDWDQRGAGRSAAPVVGLRERVADLIELVAWLREHERPPALVLVGYSWGSLLALLALEEEPRLADGVVGIGQLVAGLPNELLSHRLALQAARDAKQPLLARLLRLEPPPYGRRGGALLRKTAYLWVLDGVVRRRGLAWRLTLEFLRTPLYSAFDKLCYPFRFARSLASVLPDIERLDLLARPPTLEVPVLFLVGQHDLVTPAELARALHDALRAPSKEMRVVAGAAHSLHYEDPDLFAATLASWYDRVGLPGGGRNAGSERERARDLVWRTGWNATSYQALHGGLERWFAPDGEALVAFARHAGVRVVAGEPVAPPEELARAARAFEVDAAGEGERVVYFGAQECLERTLRGEPGHARVLLGAQPVWDPAGWSEVVARHRSVRAQLNRARNKGVRVERWAAPSEPQLASLRALLEGWLARKGLPRLRFLTDPDTLQDLGDRRLLVALRGGEPVGFLVASPVPMRGGWLVEQVVRRADAPNGTTELLVDAILRAAAAEGSRYLTLGLVPLSRHQPAAPTGDPAWLRWTLRWVRAHGRRFYNFEGLEYFKAKLRPDRWEPVWAISNEPTFSPRSLWAVAAAFSGGSPLLLVGRALANALREETGRLMRRRADPA